jgi:outer membrane protein insertion porin family
MSIKCLKILFISTFYLFSFFLPTFADVVEKIEISGNNRISDETIKMFSGANLNENLELNEIDTILKEIYNSNFFDDVSIIFTNNVLTIKVVEKPIIENIEYNGIKINSVRDDIYNSRILKPRSSYDKNYLKKDKNRIYNILKDLGYYFSTIETNIETLLNNKINIIYNIELGDKSKITKISFIGDKIYKDKKLKNIIVSEEYKFWKIISGKKFLNENVINLDKRLLKNFYLNKGYHDVEINTSFAKLIKNNEFELIYNINANQKFYFDNVELELIADFNKDNYLDVYKFFDDLKGKSYSIYKIRDIINKIENISIYEQFESVKVITTENIISDKINIKFKIEESEKFFVEKINIYGNNITQENVIRNQFKIDEGDPFNEILYNKSINNIKNLGFFKSTKGEILSGDNPNSKILNISVEEKATGEISLGAGTGTSGATIGFTVKENNFLGKGINLNLSTSITEETLKGQFYVHNPNFNDSDKSVYFGVDAIEIDRSTDFGYKTNKTGFSVGTNFEYLDDLNFGVGSSNFYEKIVTDGSASALQKTQDGNYWDSFLMLDFDYDKRNQKYETTEGFKSYYSINIPVISDTNTLVNSYKYDYFTELYENNITTASLFLKTANSISGNNIKLSERLFIPGKKLRGFEKGKIGPKDGSDYIGGNFVTAANLSSTLPQVLSNLQDVDFVFFLDAANVWGVDYNSSIDDMGEFRSSVGVGVDWLTPVGPLSFTFAQPITKESSDITETFRFNLGTTF